MNIKNPSEPNFVGHDSFHCPTFIFYSLRKIMNKKLTLTSKMLRLFYYSTISLKN